MQDKGFKSYEFSSLLNTIPPSVPVPRAWVESVNGVMAEMASHAEDCMEESLRLRQSAQGTQDLEMQIAWNKQARKLEQEAARLLEWAQRLNG